MKKPFSQACENNKQPILQRIEHIYTEASVVWEIGSGSGQHACYFARQLPHLIWQPTDQQEYINGVNLWVEEAGLPNLCRCLPLNVVDEEWPVANIDALFSANTLHIMHWAEVMCLFERLQRYLAASAKICIYGPFNYGGHYTSPSNEAFDGWLKQRDPNSGIRDIEAVQALAMAAGLQLREDFSMPANNRLLFFAKG